MRNISKSVIASVLLFFLSTHITAQNTKDSVPEKFVFTRVITLPASPVKDQAATGTCWSFATTSFIESELLRMTKDTFDLSEMYFVRNAYKDKAMQYVRKQGTANFGQGGEAHDVMDVIRKLGMVTQAAYSGLANGQTKPAHAEMEAILESIVKTMVKNPGGKLYPEWPKLIDDVLDLYLGKVPSTFGKDNLSPIQFAKSLPFNPDDYIELTSYTHHPFYTSFVLEIPDNWSGGSYYNVPPDDLIAIIDHALQTGYTVDWDGDMSDKGFSHIKGLAIVPDVNLENATDTDRNRWEKLPEKERGQQFYSFEKPIPEKVISTEMRQTAFDNYSSTDDHLMHITGTVTDQNGKRYFRTKNSWGTERNSFGGYLNMSESYVRLNTLAIMVHKDALPKDIKKKLALK